MTPDPWIIMPVIDCLDYTVAAVEDCLEQNRLPAPPRILIIDNGSTRETRRALEALAAGSHGRVLYWPHNPPLGGPPMGTVNATWNAGLDFAWRCGAAEALVVNNDILLHETTYTRLRAELLEAGAFFVSAVGVREEQFQAWCDGGSAEEILGRPSHGGPDFSCFLISKECHDRYRFDEDFTYFGDNDYHRRLILGGDGDRIYSINIPYLHFGSRTVNRSPEAKAAASKVFAGHEKRYLEKWGGPPHAETFQTPFNR